MSVTKRSTRGGPAAGELPEPELTEDEIFEVLSARRRRYALEYVKQHDGPIELGELAEQVAAWENDTPVEEVRSNERKNVYTALRQLHLPKMEEIGVVDFDKRAGTIALTEQADELDIYFEIVGHPDVPWSVYYAGLSGLFGALLIGAQYELAPLDVVSTTAMAAIAVLTFLCFSLVHTYTTYQMRLGTSGVAARHRG